MPTLLDRFSSRSGSLHSVFSVKPKEGDWQQEISSEGEGFDQFEQASSVRFQVFNEDFTRQDAYHLAMNAVSNPESGLLSGLEALGDHLRRAWKAGRHRGRIARKPSQVRVID